MPCFSNKSTLSISLLSVTRELEYLLLPASRTSRVGVEGKLIAIIDIALSYKIENISTTGIGG